MGEQSGISRRGLVAGSGVSLAAVGAIAGFAGGRASASSPSAEQGGDTVDLAHTYDFYTGGHQVGIETPQQRHTVFMTFDLVDGVTTQDLQVLLARWSAGIAQLMKGRPVGAVEPVRADGVAPDTGEAYDLSPASLTVTLGLGPGFFDERYGLSAKRPALLKPLPALPSDQLRPELTGGDLSLQACADDPQVAYHAIRDLARMARGTVTTKWTVLGFGRASASKGQTTPRNLMGFKDGTRNIKDADEIAEHVWIDEQDWMTGGTYQVVRKIDMDIEIWDAATITTQHQTFGRTKVEGAPLTGHKEFDTPNFDAVADGKPVIDPAAHIALASHERNNGVRILRRGYNFTDGINDNGQLDAGLLFISYQKDPQQFITLQQRLGSSDLLNEYIRHVGSGLFAIPPAPKVGHYIGESLFS
ncbi:iron uptake transporter deferrochelatase/peroxidase subunit [Nocardioides sp. Kera G14]|uniref:iron uptake transporter deferrochelatase/peroxidase subunit n=1 Tax=Nocardioides sp. Kera G14 TaxID=2884264 RepID=UPI001D1237DF|nr:iron uptake transporter deferrochelatase/peroxidase subunit [Nocardioides sp. Kera G14]UDY22719.1 iron uptake transporter deferrochelatase/peroxidase subunit [Nocardioides sp. Kera G14]